MEAGERLGPYEILGPLGAGGMGVVWRARDTRLGRDVALKVLPSADATDDEARARLLREARMASKLSHPNICTIYDIGESEGQAYIGMELVEGQSLSTLLSTGPLAINQVLHYGQQLADALSHAHARGVVHRDLKSANIMVTPEGQVRVLDFGLAKRLPGEALDDATTALRDTMTSPGTVAGTLPYMAPEQLRAEPADERSDVWALGVVLYEMAAGKRPFRGQTSFELTSAILSQPQPKLPDSLPVALSTVVDRCLKKLPGERYQSGEQVSAALEAVRAGTTEVVPPSAELGRTTAGRRRWPWAAVAPGVVIAITAMAALDLGGFKTRLLGGLAAPTPAIKLAVLPFTTLGGDPDQEFLAEGVTQELVTQLGRLNPEALRVIGRTSVQQYKDADTPIDQIGRELGVDYVLEGSVQREAERLHVAAELVHVGDQTQVWSHSFEQEISGILLVQSQVTRSVASALAVALLPAEQARLAAARAVDPVVYESVVRGNSLWQSLTPADLDAAEQEFEHALERDPYYAPAHAGLATLWAVRNQGGLAAWDEAIPKAREFALRAIELDDGSAEAHFALAVIRTWGEWDWSAAAEAWTRALELNPNDANTQAFYGHFLMHRRRAEQGLRHSDLAVELDPGNALYRALRGMVLVGLGRNDEALEAARTAASLRPDLGVAYSVMQRVYIVEGMRDEQLADQRMRIARDPDRVAAFEQGLAEGGYEGAQRAIADLLAERHELALQDPEAASALRSQGRYFMGTSLALRYLDAGDHDRAIAWLQRAYDERDPNLPYINQPPYDRLRDDPRYQALLSYVGIPPPAP